MKIVAIILNFFIPGVGSLAAGQQKTGLAQLGLYAAGLLVMFLITPMGWLLTMGAWIWGLVTAATYDEATKRSSVGMLN